MRLVEWCTTAPHKCAGSPRVTFKYHSTPGKPDWSAPKWPSVHIAEWNYLFNCGFPLQIKLAVLFSVFFFFSSLLWSFFSIWQNKARAVIAVVVFLHSFRPSLRFFQTFYSWCCEGLCDFINMTFHLTVGRVGGGGATRLQHGGPHLKRELRAPCTSPYSIAQSVVMLYQ